MSRTELNPDAAREDISTCAQLYRGGGLRRFVRSLAALGLALTALMQVVFFLTAGDRPFPYAEIQILAVLASAAAAFGAWRGEAGVGWLAAGLGVNALARFAQIAMGLSRLPLTLNLALLAGYTGGALFAALWARRPAEPAHAARTRAALWLLAAAYFLSTLTALSRLTAAFALAVGAAGMALAAPNVGLSASRATPEGRSG